MYKIEIRNIPLFTDGNKFEVFKKYVENSIKRFLNSYNIYVTTELQDLILEVYNSNENVFETLFETLVSSSLLNNNVKEKFKNISEVLKDDYNYFIYNYETDLILADKKVWENEDKKVRICPQCGEKTIYTDDDIKTVVKEIPKKLRNLFGRDKTFVERIEKQVLECKHCEYEIVTWMLPENRWDD